MSSDGRASGDSTVVATAEEKEGWLRAGKDLVSPAFFETVFCMYSPVSVLHKLIDVVTGTIVRQTLHAERTHTQEIVSHILSCGKPTPTLQSELSKT